MPDQTNVQVRPGPVRGKTQDMTIPRTIITLALSGVLALGTAGAAQAKHGADDGARHHAKHHKHHKHHHRHGNDDGANHG